MREGSKGVLAMALASTIWGFTGYYFKLVDQASHWEVLAHRIWWSLLTFLLIILLRKKIREFLMLLFFDTRTTIKFFFGSSMITLNWIIFLFAVQNGYATEASLGYFIFPLTAVLAGSIFLKEKFTRWQWFALGIAALGVGILTISKGVLPWIPLSLAITFLAYSLVKKNLTVDPIMSVTTDVLLVAPIALGFLVYVHWSGVGEVGTKPVGFFGNNPFHTLMYLFSGLFTAGPLILLTYSTARIKYTEVGLIQYLNPTLQFLLATLVIGEVVSNATLVCFCFIWIALAIYSFEQLRLERDSRNREISSGKFLSTE